MVCNYIEIVTCLFEIQIFLGFLIFYATTLIRHIDLLTVILKSCLNTDNLYVCDCVYITDLMFFISWSAFISVVLHPTNAVIF